MLIAVLVCVLSAQRYGNVLDYAEPNLASDQDSVYTPNSPQGDSGPGNGPSAPVTGSKLRAMASSASGIAAALGSHDLIALDTTSASLQHAAAGRSWSGPIYAATPSLLQAFGIKAPQINPAADILTMRPGLSGLAKMQLRYGDNGAGSVHVGSGGGGPGGGGQPTTYPCPLDGLSELSSVPTTSLLLILISMPLLAVAAGWLLAGREPPGVAHQPIE